MIDCHTKMVAGNAIADHMGAELVCDAIAMAAEKVALAPEAIFHSDRGCQPGLNRSSQHLYLKARVAVR